MQVTFPFVYVKLNPKNPTKINLDKHDDCIIFCILLSLYLLGNVCARWG